MKSLTLAALTALSLMATSCATGGDNFSRDGETDEANVDSGSATGSSSTESGEESRNVDFRSSTSSLPDTAHPSADHNANGQMVNEGQSRDGSPN